jgi:hypothetical protein
MELLTISFRKGGRCSNTHSGNAGSSSSDFIHLPVLPFWILGKMDKCSLPDGVNEIPA